MYFSEASGSSAQLLFQKNNFLGTGISWEESLFVVLRNQLHSIYTWKDFQLTIIYSFKYTMGWSDFEILQFFIIENTK